MSKNFYRTTILRTEPNMRSEFDNMMDGLYPEIPKAQNVILRKMKRVTIDPIITDTTDANYDADRVRMFHHKGQIPDYYVPSEGYLQFCPCIDSNTGEPDVDSFCPICHGEGYIWEESFIDSRKVVLQSDVGKSTRETLIQSGLTNIPLVIFYTKSSVLITKSDKIVELWTDNAGSPKRPYRRKSLYRIGTSVDFRSDNGKLEYWKLDCYEEQRKYLNGPEVG